MQKGSLPALVCSISSSKESRDCTGAAPDPALPAQKGALKAAPWGLSPRGFAVLLCSSLNFAYMLYYIRMKKPSPLGKGDRVSGG